MRVLVTGAGGLVGGALTQALQNSGDAAKAAPRARSAAEYAASLGGCEAVVNLAGASVLARRWTPARQQELRESRVNLTERLVEAMESMEKRPRVMVSASAVGYYGDRGEEELNEASSAGGDFLARLCRDWETAARGAEALGVRLVMLRISVVLARRGGALAQMLPPFRLGLGGPVGAGRQYFPWIHLDDLVEIVVAALSDERYSGIYNAAAPEAVTSREFARALGHALHRPAVLPLPAWALRLRFGDAAQPLLASQRVRPRRLQEAGFGFRFPTLGAALSDCTGNPAPNETRA